MLLPGTSGVGTTVIGKLESSLISGGLVKLPRISGFEAYTVIGDVALDNKIVLENQTMIMDCGTDNIQGYDFSMVLAESMGLIKQTQTNCAYQENLRSAQLSEYSVEKLRQRIQPRFRIKDIAWLLSMQ